MFLIFFVLSDFKKNLSIFLPFSSSLSRQIEEVQQQFDVKLTKFKIKQIK